ncbi:MAG: helix-turn-helix transcriptional regulator [Leptolyngbyaceae cyanobacterium CRU_2_3]|nr:helix-turn-helix transcriptional regulator [Leptolyngbyaceae cyanobacterium CRU_2_3]
MMTYIAIKTPDKTTVHPSAIASSESSSQALSNDSHLKLARYPGQDLLRSVVESWIDGILILNDQGQWLESNGAARQICERLSQNQSIRVPETIWKICRELIHSRQIFPKQPVVIESEITVEGLILRVRVQWFAAEETDRPYLMVILEDRYQSNVQRAIAEVDQFHLSPREAEVWLLHRTGQSYKAIAQALYISPDTVKKHLKSARNKQQEAKLTIESRD